MMKETEVLIVDDELEFREMILKRLKKRGVDCQGAENGEEAVEKIKTGRFDVVLLDVKMPGIDGIETLRQIKQLKPLVEVVMLTGHASVESGIEGMKFGAFDYLMKPIELDSLLEKLKDAAVKKELQEERIEQAQIRKNMVIPS